MNTARHIGFLVLLSLLAACDDGESGGEPSFQVEISASRAEGNVPLSVDFEPRVGGPLDNEYTYEWSFGDGETSAAEAPTHVFRDVGGVVVTLVVTEASGAQVTATLPVDTSPSADLVVSEVGASPRQVRSGNTVNVLWTLENTGAPVIGPWEVAVVLSTDDTFGPDDQVLLTQPPPGEFDGGLTGADAEFTLPEGLASGDYYVGVVADPEQMVGETDRDDNVAFTAVPLAVRNPQETGADLVICGLDVPAFTGLGPGDPAVVQLGDQLDVQVCLSNIGDRPAAQGGYALYLSADEVFDEDDTPVGVRAGVALGSGDRETFTDLVDVDPALSPGTYYLLSVADPDELVEEQLEDNNTRPYAVPIQVAEPGNVSGVDLALQGLTVPGERAFWDQTLPGEIVLVNRGDEGVSRRFVVRVEAEPVAGGQTVQVGSLNVEGIDAGEMLTLDVPIRITRRLDEGDYRLSAVADPTNGVGDVNPGNNRRTLQTVLTLGGEPNVDPAVDSVSVDPSRVDAGGQVIVVADLTNLGRDSTGQVTGLVILSADAVVGPDVIVLDEFSVPDLIPGETERVERQVIIPADVDQNVVQWRIGVFLDPEDRVVGEGSEENNVRFANTLLTVEGAMGGCAEDVAHEPNNDADAAVGLEPGAYAGLGACDEADWFSVDVAAGASLSVSMTWDASDGLATLDLADAEGALIQQGQATGVGGLEAFTAPVAADTTYLVRVTGGGAELQYDLNIATPEAGDAPDLRVRAVETTPSTVRAGAPVGVSFEVVNVGGASTGGVSTAEVRLAADPAGERGPGGGAPAVLGQIEIPTLAGGEAAPLRADVTTPEGVADGQYYALVMVDAEEAIDEAEEGNNQAAGRLRVDAEQACAADPLEPNVSPLEEGGAAPQAAELAPGSYPDLVSCAGDDDWYAVQLSAGERLEASATFVHADGDLEMQLYGLDGETLIDESRSLQNQEAVRLVRAEEAGVYFLRIFVAGEGSNTYQLELEVRGADACQDDDLEPNDADDGARILRDGNHDLVLCPGDADWFRFAIAAGTSVSFAVDPGRNGITLTLFDPTGEQVEEADNRIFHQAERTGQYRLRVQSDSVDRRLYALTIGGVSGIDLTLEDLRVAPESAAPGAEIRATGNLRNLRGDAAEGVVVRFYLGRVVPRDDSALVLGEIATERLDGAATAAIRKKLTLPGDLPPGAWQLFAVVDPDTEQPDIRRANNESSVPFNVQDACVDDDARENEGPRTATPLGEAASPVEAAVICAFTEDWYALPVLASGPVDITLDFSHAEGDLDLRVYDAEGSALLGESAGEADGESVQVVIGEGEAPTTLLIRVDGFFDAENTYTLSWSTP